MHDPVRLSAIVLFSGTHCFYTRTSRLPVIYVFGRKEIDVDKCITEFMNVFDQDHPVQDENAEQPKTTLLLRHDVAYTHAAGSSFFSLPTLGIYNYLFFQMHSSMASVKHCQNTLLQYPSYTTQSLPRVNQHHQP